MINLKHFVQRKKRRKTTEEKGEGGGEGRGRWRGSRTEERSWKGSYLRKWRWRGGGGGGGEGTLVEKGGAFDLKFRPGGNRGGVTHSNACFPASAESKSCSLDVWLVAWKTLKNTQGERRESVCVFVSTFRCVRLWIRDVLVHVRVFFCLNLCV